MLTKKMQGSDTNIDKRGCIDNDYGNHIDFFNDNDKYFDKYFDKYCNTNYYGNVSITTHKSISVTITIVTTNNNGNNIDNNTENYIDYECNQKILFKLKSFSRLFSI